MVKTLRAFFRCATMRPEIESVPVADDPIELDVPPPASEDQAHYLIVDIARHPDGTVDRLPPQAVDARDDNEARRILWVLVDLIKTRDTHTAERSVYLIHRVPGEPDRAVHSVTEIKANARRAARRKERG